MLEISLSLTMSPAQTWFILGKLANLPDAQVALVSDNRPDGYPANVGLHEY